jgi:hypothetical protein
MRVPILAGERTVETPAREFRGQGEFRGQEEFRGQGEFRGQCGSAMPRTLVGGTPTWVIASHEPSIEPFCASGNGRADA